MGGTISQSNLIWYYPLTTTEGSSHGGDIDTNNSIPDATDENIFDDVTDEQRVNGSTEYRKIFLRNENSVAWKNVVGYISQDTESSDDYIEIAKGGTKDTRDSVSLTGTLTFTNGSSTVTGSSTVFTDELGENDYIKLDSDGVYYEVASVTSDTELELTENYTESGGTGDSTRQGGSDKTFYTPDNWSHSDAIGMGSIESNGYTAYWIKRVVSPDSSGYSENSFKIKAQST